MPKIRLLKSGEVSEQSIHKATIQWARLHPTIAPYVIHIPNEGARTGRYGNLLKDLGMRPGVLDILIALPRHDYHGAWIELKSRLGILSEAQKEFIADMRKENYFTAVCYSLDEAIATMDWYCFK